MLFSVEQAFVRRDEKLAPLKTPAWEASRRVDCLFSLRNFLGGTDFVQFCADSEIFVPARECANKRPVALASPMACGSRVPPRDSSKR